MKSLRPLRVVRLSVACALLIAPVPALAATFTVTSTANIGPGSLHQAITDANANAGADLIHFNVGAGGLQTFTLTNAANALPVISEQVTIDGTTQPGYAGVPLIDLNGNLREASGLVISAGNSILRGLIIRNFGRLSGATQVVYGIRISGPGGNTVENCWIGVTNDGSAASGIEGDGIFIDNSPNNTIGGTAPAQRNIVSGASNAVVGGEVLGGMGIRISGSNATGNTILNSYIGVDVTGTLAVANAENGVVLSGAGDNIIGGATPGSGNVISANSRFGILIVGPGADDNIVGGNIIGLNATGEAKLGNLTGIRIENSSGNTIGGSPVGAQNTISGNGGPGLLIIGESDNNTVGANFIGTNRSGTVDLGNASDGIRITDGASGNIIGGLIPGARNIISGNGNTAGSFADGISISDPTSSGNTVQGNFIGVDVTGTLPIGNTNDGVAIFAAPNNLILNNVIGGNGNFTATIKTGSGVTLDEAVATGNILRGNVIGTDLTGTIDLGNARSGLHIRPGVGGTATGNTIGGLGLGDGNIFAFNDNNGGTVDAPNLFLGNFYFGNLLRGLDVVRGDNEGDRTQPITALASASSDGATTTTQFSFPASNFPAMPVLFEFFASPQTGANGEPEARTLVGRLNATTDASGAFSGQATFPLDLGDQFLTANASIGSGVLSEPTEFGVPLRVLRASPTIGDSGSANNPDFTTAGDPVNTRTGELFDLEAIDFNLGGPMPLRFFRYYGSRLGADRVPRSALGLNRLHNFDSRISFADATHANVTTNRGRVIRFEKSGGVWNLTGQTDVPFQLVESGTKFILGDPRSQLMWSYDAGGRLEKIEDGRGNVHTLTYTGALLTSVADGLGRGLTLTYAGDQLTSVSDGTRTVQFAYTGANLTSATDALGKATTFAYDGNGLLITKTLPKGNTPIAQSFTNEKVTAQTEIGAHTTSIAYNGTSTTVTDPTGATRTHNYGANGELTSYVDEAGKTIAFTSDAAGRRQNIVDRLGRTTSIHFHGPSGLPRTLTNADGTTTTFDYSSRTLNGLTFFDLSTITFPDGTTVTFSYDAAGNRTKLTDQANKETTLTYNNRGQVLTITNPLGGVARYEYNDDGTLSSSKDVDVDPTTYGYDALRRFTVLRNPDATQIILVYDAADRIVSITDERGQSVAFEHDDNGNVIRVIDPDGRGAQISYDGFDRAVEVIDRLGRRTSRSFNSRGLLASETDSLNQTTTFTYDARQLVTGVTQPGGETVTFAYDDEARLTSVTDPLAHTSSVMRNVLGRVTGAIDALGRSATLSRDSLQRITSIGDRLERVTSYEYDVRGSLTKATHNGLPAAEYSYDALGDLIRIVDPKGAVWNLGHTAAGRQQAMQDPLGQSTTYTYDSRGRLSQITLPDATTCVFTYDAASNVTRLQYSDGSDFSYSYDSSGRVVSVPGVALTLDAEGQIINGQQNGRDFAATYDADGRLLMASYANGFINVNYTYDVNDRLVTVNDTLSGASVTFAYDAIGRVVGVTRSNGINSTLTYDAADRLTRIQDGTFLDLQYTLNAEGEPLGLNMTAPIVSAVTAESAQFTYDAASQISSAGFSYDARGRVVAAPNRTFAWDGASRLRTIDTSTLTYNGFADLVTRSTPEGTTRHYYHYAIVNHPLVAEANDVTGQFTRFYVWTATGTLLYAIDATQANAPVFYHFDRIGSTLALTNAAGAITDAYAYSPYGELLGRSGTNDQPFRYVGAFGVRAENGIYQMRARYYDPVGGRFLSRDPAGGRLADPRTLDPYSYANNSPLRYVDPNGASATNQADYGGLAGFGFSFLKDIRNEQEAREAAQRENFVGDQFVEALPFLPETFSGTTDTETAAALPEVEGTARIGFRIADDSSPRPADRVVFNFNYFGPASETNSGAAKFGAQALGKTEVALDFTTSDGASGAAFPVTTGNVPDRPDTPPQRDTKAQDDDDSISYDLAFKRFLKIGELALTNPEKLKAKVERKAAEAKAKAAAAKAKADAARAEAEKRAREDARKAAQRNELKKYGIEKQK